MVFFPNQTLELWETTESPVDKNSYYEPKKTYTFHGEVECDFQSMSPKETLNEFGEVLQDTYKAYLPQDTDITSSMLCRILGEPDTYAIIGTPINNNHLKPVFHKKIILQKQRKPTLLERDDDG